MLVFACTYVCSVLLQDFFRYVEHFTGSENRLDPLSILQLADSVLTMVCSNLRSSSIIIIHFTYICSYIGGEVLDHG